MRAKGQNSGITVNGIAGTHSTLLGMDAEPSAAKGLLGFAIHRTDRSIGESRWLSNSLCFKGTPEKQRSFSCQDQPIQLFRWTDMNLEPQHRYGYKVVPVYGKPGDLVYGDEIKINLTAESQAHSKHSIFFNRSVSATQGFFNKFGKVSTQELMTAGHPALPWLSRGLLDGMFDFIGKARDARYTLRCCLYEFQFLPVLYALRAAAERGVDVHVVCDDKGASEPNREAIALAKIGDMVTYRKGKGVAISHNKFMVLLKNDKPFVVWTGSTNVTSGGIFGQSNVGHVVRDARVASQYFAYWQQIKENPTRKDFAAWTEANTPVHHPEGKESTHVIFSPRESLEALEYYAAQMDLAQHGAFLTSAFGVSNELAEIFAKRKNYLRFVLMDNKGQKQLRKNTTEIQKNPFNQVALGDIIHNDSLAQWHQENLTGLNSHVRYVHTKYMLIDPLSSSPVVISGSANFSNASTTKNDENMLVIRNNTRVADVYITEFMRLFDHFYFRNQVDKSVGYVHGTTKRGVAPKKARKAKMIYLASNSSWTNRFYKKEVDSTERLYFAGKSSK